MRLGLSESIKRVAAVYEPSRGILKHGSVSSEAGARIATTDRHVLPVFPSPGVSTQTQRLPIGTTPAAARGIINQISRSYFTREGAKERRSGPVSRPQERVGMSDAPSCARLYLTAVLAAMQKKFSPIPT